MLKSVAFKPILIPDVVPDFGIDFARLPKSGTPAQETQEARVRR